MKSKNLIFENCENTQRLIKLPIINDKFGAEIKQNVGISHFNLVCIFLYLTISYICLNNNFYKPNHTPILVNKRYEIYWLQFSKRVAHATSYQICHFQASRSPYLCLSLSSTATDRLFQWLTSYKVIIPKNIPEHFVTFWKK